MSARYSWRQTRILYQVATVGDWRDRAWGHGVKEPDWRALFATPEQKIRLEGDAKEKIELQKRLLAEARAKLGGKIGRSDS